MPTGGTLHISARNCPPDDIDRPAELPVAEHVAIAVRDSGQGMTPEVQARVLEPFFTTKERGRGTGLGLPMVHGFARQSGGALRIESRPGEGTLIEIYLPRSNDALVALQAEAPHLDRGRHGNATILVVDDDAQVRPVAAGFLRELGYAVIEAPDAETAFALAHTADAIDLVVTDVVMPGVDGTDLAGRLRAVRPALPVLFMTGHAQGADLAGERVLAKPFTLADLAAQTLSALGRDEAVGGTRAELGAEYAGFPPPDRIWDRLRAEALRALYALWRAARGAGPLPPYARFDTTLVGDPAHLFVAVVEGEAAAVSFRYLQVGTALTERLGRPLSGERVSGGAGEEVLGALEGAYRRCARTGTPSHEYVRFDLGDGAPVLFERLLLPFAEDGQTVTHLVGMVTFTDLEPTSMGEESR